MGDEDVKFDVTGVTVGDIVTSHAPGVAREGVPQAMPTAAVGGIGKPDVGSTAAEGGIDTALHACSEHRGPLAFVIDDSNGHLQSEMSDAAEAASFDVVSPARPELADNCPLALLNAARGGVVEARGSPPGVARKGVPQTRGPLAIVIDDLHGRIQT